MAVGNKKGRNLFILACVAPALVLFVIFMIIPTINVFRMSMYKWGGFSPNQEFVGFDNFKILFERDDTFVRSFQNTILLLVIVSLITFTLALIFASMLSREKIMGQNFFRIVFYIPNILSIVVISGIFSALYNPKNGLFNSILEALGIDPVMWLGNQQIVVYAIAIAMIWQAIGYYMVMYMASMSSIPESLYESSGLDGAGKVRQFFSITIPLVWSNVRTTLTFFIISAINMSFLFVTAMTNGGPDNSSQVFLSYMYEQAYGNSSYGYGMAIGTMVFIFSFGLAAVLNAVTKREPLEY
ncbi:MAG TPA: ABC transporter permease [Clostridiales bacterium]|nr:ABC transporter permease [Clostridiales bacterium]